MDSSGYFASMGFSTTVILDPSFSSDSDVTVITTNSRAEAPNIAGERAKQAVRSLAGRAVYKKIDSTLRGNIGVELEAAIAEITCEKAVVAPAFPAVGRTTMAGVLLVNGVPVAETQFANDPILPVKESHIPSLLEQSTRYRVGCIAVEDIEAGPGSLCRQPLPAGPAPLPCCRPGPGGGTPCRAAWSWRKPAAPEQTGWKLSSDNLPR